MKETLPLDAICGDLRPFSAINMPTAVRSVGNHWTFRKKRNTQRSPVTLSASTAVKNDLLPYQFLLYFLQGLALRLRQHKVNHQETESTDSAV